jgi:hypothetical protein
MILSIDNTKSISSLQQEFTSTFPFLRLEFFSKGHKENAGTRRKWMKDGATLLKDCRPKVDKAAVDIDENMTVGEFEQMFEEAFGLHVQVFRRSGRLWLETTATDSWTLKYQNEQGRELSSNGDLSNNPDQVDYHDQE